MRRKTTAALLAALCLILLLPGCGLRAAKDRPAVTPLSCTAPTALSALYPAGGSRLLVTWADYEQNRTTVQLVDADADTVRQETVLELLPQELRRRGLSPVGRLDKDTEGLLLLTDDGQTAHRLLSPKYHVDKVYFARVEGQVDGEDCRAFGQGMTLGDGTVCRPAGLEPLPAEHGCLVTLREGRFHQVKRMLAARGKPVVYLKRLSMGKLPLDPALDPGQFRLLTQAELAMLTDSFPTARQMFNF